MTTASKAGWCAVFVAAGLAAVSCGEPELFHTGRDSFHGMSGRLHGNRHHLPLVATLRSDPGTSECRVEHWRTLHPDEPDRAWAWAPLQRFEIVSIRRFAAELGEPPVFAFAASTLSTGESEFLFAAPWEGEAGIECGGAMMVAGTLVLVDRVMADDETVSDRNPDYDGLTSDQLFELAAANVASAGIRPVVDNDLATPNPCYAESADSLCYGNEPLAPGETERQPYQP